MAVKVICFPVQLELIFSLRRGGGKEKKDREEKRKEENLKNFDSVALSGQKPTLLRIDE